AWAYAWRWPPTAIAKQARCRTGRADSRELASRTGVSALWAEGITRSRRLGPPVAARGATRAPSVTALGFLGTSASPRKSATRWHVGCSHHREGSKGEDQ